jgi:excisionase family DNA binding protein
MDSKGQEQIALHRWAVIAEAASDRLTAAERGALVRQIAARAHTHPDGSARRYSRFPRRLIAERRIRFVRVGRHVRIPESAVREVITAGTIEPVPLHRRWRAA